jgi:polyisoprenoid-binding protein YceI
MFQCDRDVSGYERFPPIIPISAHTYPVGTANFVLCRTSKLSMSASPQPAFAYRILPSNDSTLAIEVSKTGLRRRRKHILFFEKFEGELRFVEEDPEASRVSLLIDAASAVCRDAWLNERKKHAVTAFARDVLSANGHSEIRFSSTAIRSKPLRGYVVEGELQIRGIRRVIKVNTVLGRTRKDSLQMDGDATVRLSDFDLPRPSSLMGLIGTKDEAEVRLLLWAIPASESKSA